MGGHACGLVWESDINYETICHSSSERINLKDIKTGGMVGLGHLGLLVWCVREENGSGMPLSTLT